MCNSGAVSVRKSAIRVFVRWYLFPADVYIRSIVVCLRGRCCNSPQELCSFSYPGLVDPSLERSVTTSPSALTSSTKKAHQRVSMQQDTSRYASATKTSIILPACITVSIVHPCSLPTYSVLQMANGPIPPGCMNHR